MPGYKKTYKRKTYRPYRKSKRQNIKRWVDGKPSMIETIANKYVGPLGKIAGTVANIAAMVNCEEKWADVASTATDLSATPFIQNFTGVAQSLGDNGRIGNKVKAKAVYLRYITTKAAAATASTIRYILVCDKEFDGAAAPLSQVLQASSSPGYLTAPMNDDYSKRFVILKEWSEILTSQYPVAKRKIYIPTDFHVLYDGVLSDPADCKENQVLLYAVCNETVNKPSMNFYGRFKFYDN